MSAGKCDAEVLARLEWFALTGDMKQWAGPNATVDTLREACRADVAAAVKALKEGTW